MNTLIILFNLKDDGQRAGYERWAAESDRPAVRRMQSVDSFDGLRSVSLLSGDGEPPYQYIEVIRVNDLAGFRNEVSDDAMQQLASEFNAFTSEPAFIVCETLADS